MQHRDLIDKTAEAHDAIEGLLAVERAPDGTYESAGIEVDVTDLEEWRDLLGQASDVVQASAAVAPFVLTRFEGESPPNQAKAAALILRRWVDAGRAGTDEYDPTTLVIVAGPADELPHEALGAVLEELPLEYLGRTGVQGPGLAPAWRYSIFDRDRLLELLELDELPRIVTPLASRKAPA